MLYVIAGNDAIARADKRRALKVRFDELDPLAVTPEELATLASTPTLTGEVMAYLLVGALASERGEEFMEIAEGLVLSPHVFLFEEEKLLKAPLTKLEKAGAKVAVLKAAAKKEKFDVFALTGALASRDRKKMWLLLTRALREGISAENVAGVLAWKARTVCASARLPAPGSARQAGGAERLAWEKLSRDIVVMYHEGHRGGGDLALLLERFALTF